MRNVSPSELKAIRIEVAVKICQSFPHLYSKIQSKTWPILIGQEIMAAEMLNKLMDLEPCIKHILDFYAKREL